MGRPLRSDGTPVHPHASGEHRPKHGISEFQRGSSPRERGTLVHRVHMCPHGRFIPTRAGNTSRASRTPTVCPVHPHASGEHAAAWPSLGLQTGSSPRERGTPRVRQVSRFCQRFIPTRAGNTTGDAMCGAGGSVHPHASGEHARCSVQARSSAGSSPRERGTRAPCRDRPRRTRFIPTRAGNTCNRAACRSGRAVHPHASGEHGCASRHALICSGSSPRERGTPRGSLVTFLDSRFIPTRAGNTLPGSGEYGWRPVHPHASGEHPRRLFQRGDDLGSSPRERGTRAGELRGDQVERFIPTRAGNTMNASRPDAISSGSSPRERGTLDADGNGNGEWRFIPTRAGNTTAEHDAVPPDTVHPHASGEHGDEADDIGAGRGSSPRERGTPSGRVHARDKRRFIPTRAGNTDHPRRFRFMSSVHPHASGEHAKVPASYAARVGSSPRERGTRPTSAAHPKFPRFIPTRAGNTGTTNFLRADGTVHPHASGEHFTEYALPVWDAGSSPRERGTP